MKAASFKKVISHFFITFLLFFQVACSSINGWMADQAFKEGQSFHTQGQAEAALAEYSKAIQNNPAHAAALFERGKLYLELNEPDLALADLEKSAQLDSQNAEAPYLSALLLLDKGQIDLALPYLDQALALDAQNAAGFYKRGCILAERGQSQQALTDLTKAISLNIQEADAYFQHGLLLTSANLWEKALADFDHAIELDDDNPLAYYWRGLAYVEQSQPEQAMNDFNLAIQMDSKLADAYLRRARIHIALEDFDQALANFEKAIELGIEDADAFYYRGRQRALDNQLSPAMADLDKAIALEPKHVGALYQRGLLHAESQDIEKALLDFNQVVNLEPNYPNVYADRGRALVKTDHFSEAVSDLDKALQETPDLPDLLFLRGFSHYMLEDWEASIEDFSQSASVNIKKSASHKNYAAYYNLALANMKMGDLRKAENAIAKAINIKSSGPANYLRGRLLFELQDYALAKASFDKSEQMDVERKITGLFKYISLSHYLSGDFRRAILYANRYLEFHPDVPDASDIQKWVADLKAFNEGQAESQFMAISDLTGNLPDGFEYEPDLESGIKSLYTKDKSTVLGKTYNHTRVYQNLSTDEFFSVSVFLLTDEESIEGFNFIILGFFFLTFSNTTRTAVSGEYGDASGGYCENMATQTGCVLAFRKGFIGVVISFNYKKSTATISIEKLSKLVDQQVYNGLLFTAPFQSGLADMQDLQLVFE
jgi:tetratricopeptide (TPR) repeat protein